MLLEPDNRKILARRPGFWAEIEIGASQNLGPLMWISYGIRRCARGTDVDHGEEVVAVEDEAENKKDADRRKLRPLQRIG